MSAASRKLSVGAKVFTDFTGKITHHTITEVLQPYHCQSRIAFQVTPMVPRSTGGPICADWFEPDTGDRAEVARRSRAQGGDANNEADRPTPSPQALSHDTEAGKKASKE